MQLFLLKFPALGVVILAAASVLPAFAQTRVVLPRMGVPIFQHLTRNSGYIFAGTVTAVSQVQTKSPDNVQAVKITFHVDEAMRGVRKGQTLVIREWTGLWEAGERYHVGERVTLFLFAPGKLGLTSPVGRELGRFQVDALGRVLLSREHVEAIAADPVLAMWRGKSEITWEEFSRGILREPLWEMK